ncbi:hypothetical protein [Nocardiopsis alborubida]|uniref:Uncharacterized protein n=1 Tax=Nocardiopsis alborubida TaxID=146802 RepID=A0A7X6RNG4_9ACTN|nr:hypothetical protein [Nocardiopsis alborubida]NKY96775.1 hypothetical protein [Nocardiopsis alborubida]
MATEHTPAHDVGGISSAAPLAEQFPVLDLLGAAADIDAYGGRAPDAMSNTTLLEHLHCVAPAERALDRAVLGLLGAARGRGLPWPRIGTALGLSADGARDRFDRAAERHPDYTAPPSATPTTPRRWRPPWPRTAPTPHGSSRPWTNRCRRTPPAPPPPAWARCCSPRPCARRRAWSACGWSRTP